MPDVLIKDLIQLPEQVNRGDFVLRLTEGVTRPEETVANYVVTPQLVAQLPAGGASRCPGKAKTGTG